jgi:RNA polymerase sigma-70 factor (ECF subfamily)
MDEVDPPRADSSRALEDSELLRRVRDRREEALAELYDRYASLLLALAHRVLGEAGEAEEVLQEAFLQVWNQAARYDASRSSVSTWLILITRSRAIDRLRTRRVEERTTSAAERENIARHASPEAPQAVLRQDRRRRLQSELARLPPEQRQVLDLAFYGGMTQTEIAAELDIPLGTVKTRTLLAMKKLRAALREEIRELL